MAYGKRRADGKTYKTAALEEHALGPARAHFTDLLLYAEYCQMLRASSAHVYLARPFVLSWSLLEAMSYGCLVLAPGAAPVREVIENEHNGLLVDLSDAGAPARRIGQALDAREEWSGVRSYVRATVIHTITPCATCCPRACAGSRTCADSCMLHADGPIFVFRCRPGDCCPIEDVPSRCAVRRGESRQRESTPAREQAESQLDGSRSQLSQIERLLINNCKVLNGYTACR